MQHRDPRADVPKRETHVDAPVDQNQKKDEVPGGQPAKARSADAPNEFVTVL